VAQDKQVKVFSAIDCAARGTCFIDFNDAAVCHFLNEAQQASLVVSEAWVLIALPDALYAYSLTRKCRTYQALAKMLTAFKLQHS
jgi:hypothetical protein